MLCKLEQGVKSNSIAIWYWFYICKFYIKRNTPWLAFALRKVRVVCPCVWNAPLSDSIETLGLNKTRPTYLSKISLLFLGILLLEIKLTYGTFFILAIRAEQLWNPQGHVQGVKDSLNTAQDMLFIVKANSGQCVCPRPLFSPQNLRFLTLYCFKHLRCRWLFRENQCSVDCSLVRNAFQSS